MDDVIKSDAIRDLLYDSESDIDDDLELQQPERPNVHFINELGENVHDPIYDSASEGELDDVDNDPDYVEDPTIIESEEDDNDPDTDVGLGLSTRPSTSTGRPSVDGNIMPKPKRRRSDKPTDEELGWTNSDIQPQLPIFTETSGILANIDETTTPFEVFSLFFPESLIKTFKSETNKYAKSITDKLRRTDKLKKNSIWGQWKTVKLHEIYLFFSIIVHMCVVKKFKLADYWSTDQFIASVYARSVMSRDRFLAILANFHISDNTTTVPYNQPGHDPLHKLRPYINHLLDAFPSSYYPHENLTVDEGTCGFRGRIYFRVYNKNKPDKYGIKLYVVCDSLTGYVLKLEVYTGKTEDSSIIGLFRRILSDYLGKGHTVFMDRFYTSPAVFDFLWTNNTKAVGTCMRNRKELPKTVVLKKLKTNETVFMRRDHLLCLKWKDKRDVLALSTAHTMTTSDVLVRSKGGYTTKTKPDVIINYNKNKTGVDRSDQTIAYYPFKRKQMKWWKKLFFHLFMTSIANAFVLYRESRPQHLRKKCHLYRFMIAIGKSLSEKGGILAAGDDGATILPSNRLTGKNNGFCLYPIQFLCRPNTKIFIKISKC